MSLPKEQQTSELLLYTKINQHYNCGLTQRTTNTRAMALHKEQQTPEQNSCLDKEQPTSELWPYTKNNQHKNYGFT